MADEDVAKAVNEQRNLRLEGEGTRMKEKIHVILDRHIEKIEQTKRWQDAMNQHKQETFEQLDSFFDLVKKRVEQRQADMKAQYKRIEAREKRRLRSRQMKLEKESEDLREFTKEFDDFFADFDNEMDFMANRCQFDYYWQEFKQLETTMKKATNFFAVSEFKFPTFSCLPTEVDIVDQIGKITDNSDFSMPLVAFNSHQLTAFNYLEKSREFERLRLTDENNLTVNDVPHYFKTVYIPDDKFLLLGGLERDSTLTSNRCFMIDDRGRLNATNDMQVPRQYCAIAPDYANDLLYVIGGYNHLSGVLPSFETFAIRARKWVLCETSQLLNTPRINASACPCGPKHVYLFGGMNQRSEFLDSIERYNTQLGIWTEIEVKMPQRIANHFCYSFNDDYIVVLGGVVKKEMQYVPNASSKVFELQDRVLVLKTKKHTWKDLKPFPFKKKLGQVVYNNHGKFFCFVVESNNELPQLFVYDVRSCFPQFNKYWEHDANQKESMQKIKGKHIQVHLAYYNTAPKRDEIKVKQTQDTIQLLKNSQSQVQSSGLTEQLNLEEGTINQDGFELIPQSIELKDLPKSAESGAAEI